MILSQIVQMEVYIHDLYVWESVNLSYVNIVF